MDGGCDRDVVHKVNEVYKARGALKSVVSNRGLGINLNCQFLLIVKSISQMEKMYSGRLWIWKRPMMLSIDMVCGRC